MTQTSRARAVAPRRAMGGHDRAASGDGRAIPHPRARSTERPAS
ncbi:MAG: hypothetical protein JWL99_3869 [Streptomyces oryziradicis]|jgi:hypothetical protein|nr:hypothetical protein [Actinacidiphila oryziradicis]